MDAHDQIRCFFANLLDGSEAPGAEMRFEDPFGDDLFEGDVSGTLPSDGYEPDLPHGDGYARLWEDQADSIFSNRDGAGALARLGGDPDGAAVWTAPPDPVCVVASPPSLNVQPDRSTMQAERAVRISVNDLALLTKIVWEG